MKRFAPGLPVLWILLSSISGSIIDCASSAVVKMDITATLPEAMADFAVHRIKGDVAAVSPQTNKAYLFRYPQDLFPSKSIYNKAAASNATAFRETNVCKTPVSVVYKEYDSNSYYGVLCTQETSLYILDATTLDVLVTVDIGGLGASLIISSQNGQDPFFYYNYGSGHDSVLGAVDIRDMLTNITGLGNVWKERESVMDSAISADGRVLYLRGPWSRSGFESIQLTASNFTEIETPSFERIFYDHRSTPPYIPDTVNERTAAGSTVYSYTLEEELGQLDFRAECWANNSNYTFGYWWDNEHYSYYR